MSFRARLQNESGVRMSQNESGVILNDGPPLLGPLYVRASYNPVMFPATEFQAGLASCLATTINQLGKMQQWQADKPKLALQCIPQFSCSIRSFNSDSHGSASKCNS